MFSRQSVNSVNPLPIRDTIPHFSAVKGSVVKDCHSEETYELTQVTAFSRDPSALHPFLHLASRSLVPITSQSLVPLGVVPSA